MNDPAKQKQPHDPCPICEKDSGIQFYEMSLLSDVKRRKHVELSHSSWNRFGWWHWHEFGQHGISIQFFKWLWIITLDNTVEPLKMVKS